MNRSTLAVGPDGDLDLRSLGAALMGRRHWIIWPTLIVAIAAGVVVNLIPPRYKSEARILYDGRENVFLRPEAEKSINPDRSQADAETLTNQVQIVLSRQLAQGVIGELKLAENPEFDPVLRGTSLLRTLAAMSGLWRDPMTMSPEERVLESWYDRLTAYAVDKSRVLVIEFQSVDPALAARIANAVADAYLRRQQIIRQEQTQGAGAWLAGEIDGLRRKVADAEARAEEFRSRNNLFVGPSNTSLGAQQLGEVNSQLAVARARKADSEIRARLIRDMLRRGEPIESSDIVNSELIRRLIEQRVTLRGQLAEQSSTLLDGHPRIKELRAQIADLDQQIRGEAEKLVRTLENDARIASARLDAMSSDLDALKRLAATSNGQDVEFRALEREAKAQRDLLESYLARYRETTARESIGSAPADAKVISSAVVSSTPAFPKKLPIVAVASLITFVLCIGMATTGELLRATAPLAPGPGAHDAVFVDPAALAAEHEVAAAVGQLRAAMGNLPRVEVPLVAIDEVVRHLRETREVGPGIAVLAAAPEIATSAPALALARALAADAKVVLIRLARPPRDAAAAAEPGLTDVVGGAATFGEIIAKDTLSRAHMVHYGRIELSLQAILDAPRFRTLMEAVSRVYAHVVVDAGHVGSRLMRLAELAPRGMLVVPDDAPRETAITRDALAAVGFADISIVSDAVVLSRPDDQVAA